MKRKQGFFRTAATLTLSGLAALLFGGCAKDDDNTVNAPQPQEPEVTVSDSTRQELNESLFEHLGTLTKAKDAHLFQDSTMSGVSADDPQSTKQVQVTQTLDFGSLTPVFAKDIYDSGNLQVLLQAAPNSVLYTMNWKFVDGFTSRVDADGNLIDLLQENLNIGGKNYRVTKASTHWMGGDVDEVSLELMTGKAMVMMSVSNTCTVQIDGVDYEVELAETKNEGTGKYSARFLVNGENTAYLADGSLYQLANGQFIGAVSVKDGTAEFSLGAHKIAVKDTNVNDSDFSGTVSGNGVSGAFSEDTDAKAKIKAAVNGSMITLERIAYQLFANTQTDTDVFVAQTKTLSESLDNPGANLVEIRFDGLAAKKDDGTGNLVNRVYSSMVFERFGADTYALSFTNKENIAYSNVGFIENVGTSASDRVLQQKLVMTEGASSTDYKIAAGTQFVLTGDTGSFTHILRYDSIDTVNRKLSFTDLATGAREATYDANTGEASIVVGGVTFKVIVDVNTGNLAIDQNGDGKIDGSSVAIVDKYGARISILSSSQNSITAGVSTSADRIDGSSVDEVVDLEFDISGTGIILDTPSVPTMYNGSGVQKGQSRYGVLCSLAEITGRVDLGYPEIQEEPVALLLEKD